MAKVPFTKLALIKNTELKIVNWKDQKIEVKQFLPTNEKLDLISRVINYSTDLNVFYNPCKVQIFEIIEIILAYTNINVTEKQGEDILKLYDLFISSGFYNVIKEAIPEEELEYIHSGIISVIDEIYRYRNSAAGIIGSLQTDTEDLDKNLNDLIEKIKTSNEIADLKQITDKLG